MTGQLQERPALITGAASGIGLATARAEQTDGAKLLDLDLQAVSQADGLPPLALPFRDRHGEEELRVQAVTA